MVRLAMLAALAALGWAALATLSGATATPVVQLGIVANVNARSLAPAIGALGAGTARVEFSIDSTPAQMAPTIAAFADHGVRVLALAGFTGRIPSAAEARGLAAWAHAFGPGGSFWRGRSRGDLAIRDIEFGNETNQGYQFNGCSAGCAAYLPRARAYALALRDAEDAIDGASGNSRVGLLAIGDDGGTDSAEWVDGMFEAVPDLARRVAGWTVHTYGPPSHWHPLLDRLVSQTAARGAPATIPIYVTEVGLASDGGRCLTGNFGWTPCMSYGAAAISLRETLNSLRAYADGRVRAIYLYQAVDQRLPGVDGDPEHYFGVLQANRSPKGAYTAYVRSQLRALK